MSAYIDHNGEIQHEDWRDEYRCKGECGAMMPHPNMTCYDCQGRCPECDEECDGPCKPCAEADEFDAMMMLAAYSDVSAGMEDASAHL